MTQTHLGRTTPSAERKSHLAVVQAAEPQVGPSPPHNFEAEQALLGAILVNANTFERIAGLVRAEEFFDPLHREIFEVAQREHEAGKFVNPITLKPFFERHEPIDGQTTVFQYLGKIGAGAPSTKNAPDYARAIRYLATQRLVIIRTEQMRERAWNAIPGSRIREDLAADLSDLERIVADETTASVVSVAEWQGVPIPPREWEFEDLLPASNVSLIFADGGTGKSTIMTQACVSKVLGRPWMGKECRRRGRALYVGAEDDKHELMRRFNDAAASENVSFDRLVEIDVLCLAGHDAVLATADERGNIVQPTALWQRIRRIIRSTRPALVVLDTLADMFAGNENNRGQARQFIAMLRGLAIETGSAIVVVAHPSQSGMASGAGTSGSTGWSNSVRSRLYLTRERQGDTEVDPDVRVLRTMKSNYGPAGGEIRLRWQQGIFAVSNPADGASPQVQAQHARAEAVFLDLLSTYDEQGRSVSASKSPTYAPAMFMDEARPRGVPKADLVAAMNRLLKAGRIRITETGPTYKRRTRLEVVT